MPVAGTGYTGKMPNPQTIAAASFWPGLQDVGTIDGTAYISGTLNQSPSGLDANSSNMTGKILVELPDPSVISILRVNFPDADGALASDWFPLFGSLQLYDNSGSNDYKLILSVGNAPTGRYIYINFANISTAAKTFTDFRVVIHGHLYTYPWE